MCLIEIWFGDRRNLYNRMKYRLVYNCPTEWPIISFILDLKKIKQLNSSFRSFWYGESVDTVLTLTLPLLLKKRDEKIQIVWTLSEKFPDVIVDRFVKMCIFSIYLNFFSLEKPTQPSILEYSGFQVVVNRLKRLRMLLSHHFCCCRCFDSICRDYNYQFEWAIDAINLIIRGFFLLKHS